MKFLCLAYGDEAGWKALGEDQKAQALAADDVIRRRGGLVSAVRTEVHTVTNWDGRLEVKQQPHAKSLPLAGFSVIEADSVEEVISLVAATPCARARGYIEVRPFWDLSGQDAAG